MKFVTLTANFGPSSGVPLAFGMRGHRFAEVHGKLPSAFWTAAPLWCAVLPACDHDARAVSNAWDTRQARATCEMPGVCDARKSVAIALSPIKWEACKAGISNKELSTSSSLFKALHNYADVSMWPASSFNHRVDHLGWLPQFQKRNNCVFVKPRLNTLRWISIVYTFRIFAIFLCFWFVLLGFGAPGPNESFSSWSNLYSDKSSSKSDGWPQILKNMENHNFWIFQEICFCQCLKNRCYFSS